MDRRFPVTVALAAMAMIDDYEFRGEPAPGRPNPGPTREVRRRRKAERAARRRNRGQR